MADIVTKFDITNKICNKCRVIEQITCFDKKKSIYNSIKVKCEYCTSAFSFSGLGSHIKSSHEDRDLAKGVHPLTEESEYYKYYLLYCKLKAKGIDIDKLLAESIIKLFISLSLVLWDFVHQGTCFADALPSKALSLISQNIIIIKFLKKIKM